MRLSHFKYAAALAIAGLATIALYFWFIRSAYFEAFRTWSESHPLLLFIALVALKVAGLVWPPFSGGVFTFGAIPVIGWFRAYASDLIGSALGSSIAYWIARRWGMAVLTRLLDEKTLDRLARIRIPRGRELEAVYLFRVLGTGSIVELICYGAGLLRIGFGSFLAGSILSHLTVSLPIFYFGRQLFEQRFWTGGILLLVFVSAALLLRKRYFERDETE